MTWRKSFVAGTRRSSTGMYAFFVTMIWPSLGVFTWFFAQTYMLATAFCVICVVGEGANGPGEGWIFWRGGDRPWRPGCVGRSAAGLVAVVPFDHRRHRGAHANGRPGVEIAPQIALAAVLAACMASPITATGPETTISACTSAAISRPRSPPITRPFA
jgi:hypothetical protein